MRTIMVLAVLLGLSGCASQGRGLSDRFSPIITAEHTSHSTQHLGNNRTNYGYNCYGLGVRYRSPDGKLVADMTECYSPEMLDGMHEVFNLRMVYDLRRTSH